VYLSTKIAVPINYGIDVLKLPEALRGFFVSVCEAVPRSRDAAVRWTSASCPCGLLPAHLRVPRTRFDEYFHGGNSAGLGASHQTGWTGYRRQADRAVRPGRSEGIPGRRQTCGLRDRAALAASA